MKRIFRPLPLPAFPAHQRPILAMPSLVRRSKERLRLRVLPSTRRQELARLIVRAPQPFFSSSRRGGIARSPSCTSGWPRRCERLFPRRRRVRTPPSRRACVRIMRIAGRVDPRWFSPCGCVPGFVANRSLAIIVTAAPTLSHRPRRKLRQVVPARGCRSQKRALSSALVTLRRNVERSYPPGSVRNFLCELHRFCAGKISRLEN